MYRDDLAAATARRDALGQELTRLQAHLVDHEHTQKRVRELTDELAELTRNIEHARRKLPMLNRIGVSTPCKEPWAKMQGDEKIRFCGRCEKNVYNLSAMTTAEAEAIVSGRGDLCVRLFRRPDGTVLTSDCPVGAKRRRRRRLVVTAVAAVAGAAGVAWMMQDRGDALGASAAPAIAHPTAVMGGMMQTPEPPPVQPQDVEQGGVSADAFEKVGKMEVR